MAQGVRPGRIELSLAELGRTEWNGLDRMEWVGLNGMGLGGPGGI